MPEHLKKLEHFLSNLGGPECPPLDEELLQDCLKEMEGTIRAFYKGRKPSISPSQTSLTARQIWHIQNTKELIYNKHQFKPTTRLKMAAASISEHLIALFMKSAGVDMNTADTRVNVNIPGLPSMKGTYDWSIGGVLNDCKIAGSANYKGKFKSAKYLAANDIFGYCAQLYIYGQGAGLPLGGWDVFNADTFEFKHIQYVEGDAINKIERFKVKIEEASKADSADDFEACYPITFKNGKLKLDWKCSRCTWLHHCFKNKEEEIDGSVVRHYLK